MNPKKFTISKFILIFSFVIFCICLAKGFTVDITNVYDTSIYVTSISVSGMIAGSVAVWYSKKAQSENAVKLNIVMMKESTENRLHYYEERIKIQQKYNVTDEVFVNADNDSYADEYMDNAETNAMNSIDTVRQDADSLNQLENFG